jgi:hypothetical protein
MNINEDIWDYAKYLGLDWHSTGGGCDYIIKLQPTHSLIIQLSDGEGGCPLTLTEPSTVTFYFGECQEQGIALHFKSTIKALRFMAMDFSITTYNIE